VQQKVVDEAQQGIEDRQVSPWIRVGGPAVLVAALLMYFAAYMRWPNLGVQIDALVYRFAAERLLAGLDLYSTGFTGNHTDLLYIYTPFAALLFIPLALLDRLSLEIVWLLVTATALTYSAIRMLRWFGVTLAAGLASLTALLVGLAIWLEPVRLTAQLGQINVLILAVVVADLLGSKQRKWAGVGIGLVAGIKLTPALFIGYLVVTKRLRAAAVATTTLVGTIAVGFALLPSDSAQYWLNRQFDDVGRISRDPIANTSVYGVVERLHLPAALATAAAIGLAVAALAIAALAYRRGQAVLAVAIVGMASAAASPFSWSHHWVWFVPLIVHLGYRAYVLGSAASAWALWPLCAVLGGWFVSDTGDSPEAGILSLRFTGTWGQIIAGSYVLVFVVVLAISAWWLAPPLAGTTVAPKAQAELTRTSKLLLSRWKSSHELRSTQLHNNFPSSRTAQTAVPVSSMGRWSGGRPMPPLFLPVIRHRDVTRLPSAF
jgi:alpha-1,2-mannosyltransferase